MTKPVVAIPDMPKGQVLDIEALADTYARRTIMPWAMLPEYQTADDYNAAIRRKVYKAMRRDRWDIATARLAANVAMQDWGYYPPESLSPDSPDHLPY
jgi:hypothetical protein